MKKRNLIAIIMGATMVVASAIPARRGVVHQLPQPDGTIVSLQLYGDEHFNYYQTTDSYIVIGAEGKYCYATIDANGDVVNSNVLVHNPTDRLEAEIALVSQLNRDAVLETMSKPRPEGIARVNNQDGKGLMMSNFPTKGEVKSVVFLVNFKDLKFTTENANSYFTRMLNEEGFDENGAYGSCRDYYKEGSMGQFSPTFDVYGPVDLPNDYAYYGKNSSVRVDVKAQEMLLHAGEALDSNVDFSQYDLDNDGFVDNVFIFYAGPSEADGAGTDYVWPHQSTVGSNPKYRFDGVQLNRYACGSELSQGEVDGIGTFCHEFGHVLGLPDLYNTRDTGVDYTPMGYDLMDSGSYNGGGKVPPTPSVYERNALGWMGNNLVEITGAATCTLENIANSNKAYLINTDATNEFFLLENRQKEGWDKYLPGHGMLIWHIDYNLLAFNNSVVNNNEKHQRVDLVEACGKTGAASLTQRKYPFPGKGNVTSFTFDGTPSFQSWSGADIGLPITDITETDGVITFNVAGGGPDPASVSDIMAENASIQVVGRDIAVSANGRILVTDIAGRIIASGNGSLNARAASSGIYIVVTPQESRKVVIR